MSVGKKDVKMGAGTDSGLRFQEKQGIVLCRCLRQADKQCILSSSGDASLCGIKPHVQSHLVDRHTSFGERWCGVVRRPFA